MTHTLQGKAILGRFVRGMCGCEPEWNMPNYISEAVEKIRAQVGTTKSSSTCPEAWIRRCLPR